MQQYFVYIMTNQNNNVLYIGVTRHLEGRVLQHKKKYIPGFTSLYNITKLVYYEIFENIYSAILREKQLKNWHRQWKINLIKKDNQEFKDLSAEWYAK